VAAKIRLGRGRRSIDDAVSHVLTHPTRIEIRAILNDGERSRDELARMTWHSASQLGWHLKELTADGTTEITGARHVGSAAKHCYCAPEVPSCSAEELVTMPAEGRKGLVGIALQASLSEALAAFWQGRMVPDVHAVAAWRWFNVDCQGHEAIADEQTRSWRKLHAIVEDASGRFAESGEARQAILVSSLRYLRARNCPRPPLGVRDALEGANEATVRLGQGDRSVEWAVSYALSDRLRIQILVVLNEGVYNRYELAALIGVVPDKLKHHLKAMLDEGSIEIAHEDRVGNVVHYYYRAVKMLKYNVEEYAALPPESRQALAGVVLQTLIAEALAAFRAGTMIDDPQFGIACRGFNVDAQGRVEVCDEQVRSWERMHEIEAEALNRVAVSGEPTKSIIVNSLGFVRSRRPRPGGVSRGADGSVLRGFNLGSPVQLPSNAT
jgi:DNA-binding transcriptional ArsR family regulator